MPQNKPEVDLYRLKHSVLKIIHRYVYIQL